MKAQEQQQALGLDGLFSTEEPSWRLRQDSEGNLVACCDNLDLLCNMHGNQVRLAYVDPPFNTGRRQERVTVTAKRAGPSEKDGQAYGGFGGHSYHRERVQGHSYQDSFDDYIGFLRPRLQEARRVLADDGSLFLHVDWREAARCRILLEEIFGGPGHCINEIIWAYDYGGRSKNRWPAKHDNIYWFAKDPKRHVFNLDAADRIPYMAPGLVSEEKAKRGKTPTDTWWHTIVATNSKEKTGYPTQKPLGIVERIVKVHSDPGDLVLDFFAGSGTTGEAARNNGRRFLLVDQNPEAIKVMERRLDLRPR